MKKIVLSVLFVIYAFVGFSQTNLVLVGDELMLDENYDQAIPVYKQLVASDKHNPDYLFNLGYCYLNSSSSMDKAVNPLRNAKESYETLDKKQKRKVSVSDLEIKFYLARAYRIVHKYDSALTLLQEIKPQVKKQQLRMVENEEEMTKKAKLIWQNPQALWISNLGPEINTKFAEHSPVFTLDQTELYFTSRRKLWDDAKPDPDGEYDENIYYSLKDKDGIWQQPKPLDIVNTKENEATISLSYDGTKLFIYKDEQKGSIYELDFKNGQWQQPVKLGKNINTRRRETSASLSYDGKTLYFTSDRRGGYGGLDIYMSKLQDDGTWGPAVNLGPTINTPEDEESPFILPDDKTLYFSSKGHGGLGGFDIFVSKLDENNAWTEPKNLGYPINTESDDVFFYPTADGKTAYFVSKSPFGLGSSDIYTMELPGAGSNLVVLKGKIVKCEGSLPPTKILVTDNQSGAFYIYNGRSNGKFIFALQRGREYTIRVDANDTLVYKKTYKVPADAETIINYPDIPVDPGAPCYQPAEDTTHYADSTLIAQNNKSSNIDSMLIGPDGQVYDKYILFEKILFPLNMSKTEYKQYPSLDSIAEYLKANPNAILRVIGYCDASGPASYNYVLGLNRAKNVKNQLVHKGVDPEQIEVASYGEENPVAKNKKADGKWYYQSMKFNRRVEFKILKQGQQKLLIRYKDIPKEFKNPDYDPDYIKSDKNIEINY